LTYDQVSKSYILKESDINSVPYQSLIISLKETGLVEISIFSGRAIDTP